MVLDLVKYPLPFAIEAESVVTVQLAEKTHWTIIDLTIEGQVSLRDFIEGIKTHRPVRPQHAKARVVSELYQDWN